MRNGRNKLIQDNLSSLVKKYSQSDVIQTIEREYKAQSAQNIATELIDDNRYLAKVKLSKSKVKSFAEQLAIDPLIEPIIVRPKQEHYEVIIGRKRLFASRRAGVEKVPALVRNYTDEETLLILLAVARDEHNVNVLEIAYICNHLANDFGYTQASLAALTHQSRPQITNIMRLLNLPDNVLRDLNDQKISYGHARALCALPEASIKKIIQEIYTNNLTVREAERLVAKTKGKKDDPRLKKLNRKYKTKTTAATNKITFEFSSEKQKDAFLDKLLKK